MVVPTNFNRLCKFCFYRSIEKKAIWQGQEGQEREKKGEPNTKTFQITDNGLICSRCSGLLSFKKFSPLAIRERTPNNHGCLTAIKFIFGKKILKVIMWAEGRCGTRNILFMGLTYIEVYEGNILVIHKSCKIFQIFWSWGRLRKQWNLKIWSQFIRGWYVWGFSGKEMVGSWMFF